MDIHQANAFSTYRGVHMGNSKVRRHGQALFLTEALEQGLHWTLSLSKRNSSKAFEDVVDLSVHNPLPAEELHLQYKIKGLMKNLNKHCLSKTCGRLSEHDPQYSKLALK
eukprot:15340903-Ditylum_brightwellii.AAC.1